MTRPKTPKPTNPTEPKGEAQVLEAIEAEYIPPPEHTLVTFAKPVRFPDNDQLLSERTDGVRTPFGFKFQVGKFLVHVPFSNVASSMEWT